jgi:hypothetical protein
MSTPLDELLSDIEMLTDILTDHPRNEFVRGELKRARQVWDEVCQRHRDELNAEAGFDETWVARDPKPSDDAGCPF